MSMTFEYTPTADDIYRLKLALHRQSLRHPLLYTMLAGGTLIVIGGAMMASIASPAWWTVSFVGAAFTAAVWLAPRLTAPTAEQVEAQFRAFAWMRDPFRIEVDEAGLRYEHGPYSARAAWTAFTGLLDAEHHLILTEHRGPGALAYGLVKRDLDRTAGGTAAWRQFLSQKLRKPRSAQ
jgi:hypothetical protein